MEHNRKSRNRPKYICLIDDKGNIFKKCKKNGFINKWYREKCAIIWRKVKLDPYLTLYTRKNFILIKPIFQYKHKMICTLDENMEKFFYKTGVGKNLSYNDSCHTYMSYIHTCHIIHETMIKSIILKSQKTKMKKKINTYQKKG